MITEFMLCKSLIICISILFTNTVIWTITLLTVPIGCHCRRPEQAAAGTQRSVGGSCLPVIQTT